MLSDLNYRDGFTMSTFLNLFSDWFETIHNFWEKKETHKTVSFILVLVFLAALAIIEFNRNGMLPELVAGKITQSHYQAVNLAFTLVLVLEVISMIFALPGSMSKAVGKQFEILALIFLRNSFKKLSSLPEPIDICCHNDVLWQILAYGSGALAIFVLLGLYLWLREELEEAIFPGKDLKMFITVKKSIAFFMLLLFFGLGFYDLWLMVTGSREFEFFHYFYTILVFSDILLVLIAQSFLPQFPAVFRNSGYAFSTLLMRLSLTASVYYDVMIGICSIVFAIVLTFSYNRLYTVREKKS